ncbi:cancer-related nucleoside-triphosphatase homolog [Argonauta hians]
MAETVELSPDVRHILITGERDVGKTMILLKTCEELKKLGYKTHGFYREEVRHFGRRKGFDVVSLDGENRAVLSRVEEEGGILNRHDPNRFGHYIVNVEEFDEFVLPLLHSGNTGITVIDEIGQLESISRGFHQAVISRLDDPRSKVFATIPEVKGRPLAILEQIRARADVKVFTVTKKNHHEILPAVLNAIISLN